MTTPAPKKTLRKQPPTPEDMMKKVNKARDSLGVAFKRYHGLLQEKILVENKSNAKMKQEKHIVDQLANAASELEYSKIGEGIMSIAIIALREHLTVRDRVNELEYHITKLEKEIKTFKSDK